MDEWVMVCDARNLVHLPNSTAKVVKHESNQAAPTPQWCNCSQQERTWNWRKPQHGHLA